MKKLLLKIHTKKIISNGKEEVINTLNELLDE